MDIQKTINQLDEIYGHGKGIEIYTTVMPGILSDFSRMLKNSTVGKTITEQYNHEDRRCILIFTGKKLPNGQLDMSIDVRKI